LQIAGLDGIADRGQNVGIHADLEWPGAVAVERLRKPIAQWLDHGGDPRAPSCFARGRLELTCRAASAVFSNRYLSVRNGSPAPLVLPYFNPQNSQCARIPQPFATHQPASPGLVKTAAHKTIPENFCHHSPSSIDQRLRPPSVAVATKRAGHRNAQLIRPIDASACRVCIAVP
jgi:hypothetical protein